MTALAIALPLFFFGIESAFSEGSAGGRGGGTGLLCDGSNSPVTIEEYRASAHGDSISVPSSRDAVGEWLGRRLGKTREPSDLAIVFDSYLRQNDPQSTAERSTRGAVLYFWKKIGAYDEWEATSAAEISRELTEEPTLRTWGYRGPSVLDTIETLLRDSNIPFGKELDSRRSERDPSGSIVGDDFFPTPANCTKAQLSLLTGRTAKRITGFALGEVTKRFLELHEAVYELQATLFGLEFPTLTQDLVVALNRGAKRSIVRALRSMTGSVRASGVTAYRELFGFGLMKRDAASPTDCPPLIAFDEDERMRVTTLERGTRTGDYFTRTRELKRFGSAIVFASDATATEGRFARTPGGAELIFRHSAESTDAIRIACRYAPVVFTQGLFSVSPSKVLLSLFPRFVERPSSRR